MNNSPEIFSELPGALVEELLARAGEIGNELKNSFLELKDRKESLRKGLDKKGLLKNASELEYPSIPTTCGVDGSYAIEKLLSMDFVACAAVGVEGLTPPSEKRHWENPHHDVLIRPEKHNPLTSSVIRALMMQMELSLATKTPHDITFLDGSFTTPIIYLNQGVNTAGEIGKTFLTSSLNDDFDVFIENYRNILTSRRTDKIYAAIPKYTTKREIGYEMKWPSNYDDRAILTNILKPGEFTAPTPLARPASEWHLTSPNGKQIKEFDSVLRNIKVIYYRPNSFNPALRVEISPAVAENKARLAILLKGISYQCGTPGIYEVYPLYLADRMVKPLFNAISAIRQTSTRYIAEDYDGDISDVFFNMHGFRTESG